MIRTECPTCRWPVHTLYAMDLHCTQCGTGFACDGEPRPQKPVVETVWPPWARLIAKRRREGEKGVGDTVSRYAGKVGGERFKRAASFIGIPCGCTARQEQWNKLYPYEKKEGTQ